MSKLENITCVGIKQGIANLTFDFGETNYGRCLVYGHKKKVVGEGELVHPYNDPVTNKMAEDAVYQFMFDHDML